MPVIGWSPMISADEPLRSQVRSGISFVENTPMKTQVDVISEQVNCPVVQMPGRRFPGVVLQGDSLRILLDQAREIRDLLRGGKSRELEAAISELEDKLAGYVACYEQAMSDIGRELPY